MLALIGEAALRACALAIVVWFALRALRIRDARVQMTAWTLVLFASLSMPLLMQWTRVAVPTPLPHLPAFVTTTAATLERQFTALLSPIASRYHTSWRELTLGVYAAIAGVLLLRLIVGIALTSLMRRTAEPLTRFNTGGRDVRATSAIRSPVTFGSTILVPREFVAWPGSKQLAVISHEQSHVEQGDFYLQLLANITRAIFWFNPVAWWLQHRLASLAETIGDDAAIGDDGDRQFYAATLLEIARGARRVPGAVAMARPATVKQRVVDILDEPQRLPQKNGRNRLLFSLALIPLVAVMSGYAAVPILHLDGRWMANMPPEGRCKFTAVLTLQVQGRTITGDIKNPEGVFPLTGEIDAMGKGSMKMGRFWGVVEFKDNHFEADYTNGCGGRHAVGQRL